MSVQFWFWTLHAALNSSMVVAAVRDLRWLAPWRAVDWAEWERGDGAFAADGLGEKDGSPNAWFANVRRELAVSPSTARIAVLNEATSELEAMLVARQSGAMRVRVCAASGLALGCWVLADSPWVAASYVGSGVVGAALTWQLGRMADSSVGRLRGRWNGLIRRLARSFPQSETLGDRPLTMQCGADERG